MENKKYLDNVVSHLVRGTKIDYLNNQTRFISYLFDNWRLIQSFSLLYPFPLFDSYCRRQFGLIHDEIVYVWNEYKSIMEDNFKRYG